MLDVTPAERKRSERWVLFCFLHRASLSSPDPPGAPWQQVSGDPESPPKNGSSFATIPTPILRDPQALVKWDVLALAIQFTSETRQKQIGCLLTELMAGAGVSYVAKKCGIRLQPPSIILIYEDLLKSNMRKRIMPVRNFSKFSDCSRAAEQLKNNPRHKIYLEGVSLEQLQKLYRLLRYHLEGQSLTKSLEAVQQVKTVDPEEDLNKLDDHELAKRKRIMDELFEKNRKKKEDPDFVYNVEVTFPEDEELEACEWDTESDEEF